MHGQDKSQWEGWFLRQPCQCTGCQSACEHKPPPGALTSHRTALPGPHAAAASEFCWDFLVGYCTWLLSAEKKNNTRCTAKLEVFSKNTMLCTKQSYTHYQSKKLVPTWTSAHPLPSAENWTRVRNGGSRLICCNCRFFSLISKVELPLAYSKVTRKVFSLRGRVSEYSAMASKAMIVSCKKTQ